MGHRPVRDLRQFLMERLDEDESLALGVLRARADDRLATKVRGGCWEPVRVLAECEAKRRIILEQPSYAHCEWEHPPAEHARHTAVRILQLLALPYAKHPDYDERWSPDPR